MSLKIHSVETEQPNQCKLAAAVHQLEGLFVEARPRFLCVLGERVGCLVPTEAHKEKVRENCTESAHHTIGDSVTKLDLGSYH